MAITYIPNWFSLLQVTDSLYNFFWITSARCQTSARCHHIYACFLHSDLGINSYKNCHIVSPHNLFIFCRNLLISSSDSLLWLAFNSSYPMECLSSTTYPMRVGIFTVLSFFFWRKLGFKKHVSEIGYCGVHSGKVKL